MTVAVKPQHTRSSDKWTEVAADWLKHLPQQLWREHSDLVNARLLDRWLPREKLERILKTDLFDEVAARGLYQHLATRAETVVALDISPMVSATARRRYPRLAGLSADVRSIPIRDESVDAVVSFSTLDHFHVESDISVALGELFRVLKPGGTLIITLDNPGNPIVAMRNRLPYAITHPLGLVPYPVGKTLTAPKAASAIGHAGFRVEECTAIMHSPRVLAIPLMNILDQMAPATTRARALDGALRFERLERYGSRFLTGHFVAIRGIKPEA